jgi:hypothetical protein
MMIYREIACPNGKVEGSAAARLAAQASAQGQSTPVDALPFTSTPAQDTTYKWPKKTWNLPLYFSILTL